MPNIFQRSLQNFLKDTPTTSVTEKQLALKQCTPEFSIIETFSEQLLRDTFENDRAFETNGCFHQPAHPFRKHVWITQLRDIDVNRTNYTLPTSQQTVNATGLVLSFVLALVSSPSGKARTKTSRDTFRCNYLYTVRYGHIAPSRHVSQAWRWSSGLM